MANADTNKASNPEKRSQKQAIAEIKNGKIIFKQKPYLLDKHSETLQELVKFRELISARLRSKLPMSELQDEYKPLVVKMAHESDKSLTSIAKQIHSQLLLIDEEEGESFDSAAITQIFPVSIIEEAIQTTMNRNNYGIELDSAAKIPNGLCVWRWEAKEPYKHYLPKTTLEKVASRIVERAHAKTELLASFNSLSEVERNALIPYRGAAAKEARTSEDSLSVLTMEQSSSTEPQGGGSGSKSNEANNSEGTKVKPKKVENPERLAKERKQNDAQKSLMANFFAKSKPGHGVAVGKKASSSSNDTSDFEKTFKPFVRKKDAEIAAVNSFLRRKKRQPTGTNKVVIVLDSDDEHVDAPGNSRSVSQLSVSERYYDAFSALPERSLYCPPRSTGTSPCYKTYHSPSVRELMKQLSEAELTDDTSAVRSITHQLADRDIFPAKVLIFHEDNRPGYFGTWTRSSHIVGSRTPFARDVLDIDYGYDSGEDWDEGDCAGGADDVVDDEDDEQDSETQDSDIDDWLVDDDEVERAVPPSSDLDLPDVSFPNKRKAEDDKKASKKRKVVIPLVPYAKGPSWEGLIGECKESILGPYQIRFLNDASYSLDPFSFVSSVNETTKVQRTDVFAVPSLPIRAVADRANSIPPNTAVKKGASAAPKTSFPEDHLPVLLDKVNRLQSSNLTLIVETVFQELRVHKVKKNAIEAKIKEVGMKCRERRYWVIRDKSTVGTDNTTAS
ncbi:hypothetical protein E1B28_008639 [Marasmius oreades]|uniref:Chromatin assembly factor 1 subunit A dimerization domain-containing protein n=1 Tax=Marasmius oreades TaxID=181124 RepID=A0A9P7RYY0_9AGAR|nr:uncharacterized protein E1B28_008639 [Marasmius oreades]KAG7092277.1 hypothetical protein E1B28_008639 [Marasmius oreades]